MSEPARRRRAGARAAGGPAHVAGPSARARAAGARAAGARAEAARPRGELGGELAGELSDELSDETPDQWAPDDGRGRSARRERSVARSDRPMGQSSPWVPALMVTFFVLGLLWLVVYYLAGTQVPGMSALGNWNLLVGIGAIAVGFVVSTQWR